MLISKDKTSCLYKQHVLVVSIQKYLTAFMFSTPTCLFKIQLHTAERKTGYSHSLEEMLLVIVFLFLFGKFVSACSCFSSIQLSHTVKTMPRVMLLLSLRFSLKWDYGPFLCLSIVKFSPQIFHLRSVSCSQLAPLTSTTG